jgi:flagellar biosynthetic protein FliR
VATFFSAIFLAALAMALPVVTLILLVDVALALLSRAAPQFNLFAIGFPVRAGVSLVALALLLPVLASQLGQLFGHLPDLVPMLTGAT